MSFDLSAMKAELNSIGAGNAGSTADNGKQVFLKVAPGTHHIRVIPAVPRWPAKDGEQLGAPIENLPYIKLVQHSFVGIDPGTGRERYDFALCYNDISARLTTLAKSLISQGLLSKEDLVSYKAHGCPACATVQKLQQARIQKEVWTPLLPKVSYQINVLLRADSKVYVFNMSKKLFQSVVNGAVALLENGIDPWHIQTGYDCVLTANGDGKNRRYDCMYLPAPKPMGLPQSETFYNLYELAGKTFKSYGKLADLVVHKYAKYLDPLGLTVPGAAIAQIFENTKPALTSDEINMVNPAGVTVNKVQEIGDGMQVIGGKLYRDGVELF